ncbi:hypothetical protein HATV-3_gp84 [Haloarcula tailed virus 3]|uniref:Uncharacterized protein n=1 Tax=Haloarcula tailed virus 3 TaxID=2877990 RepID=A0AAE8Y0U8_9CAUD|nr:hypothetical protein M1M35_gp84 [Haloarcula tailed virus 3]UBF23434.1 hypothetical protein HATV-3_gp84 [Haloarcula tailed virus 3]
MSKITVTDYETVEKEQTKYECDHCGVVVDEDDINTVGIFEGVANPTARLSDNSVAVKHLCNGCNDVPKAMRIQAAKATVKDRWEAFAGAVSAGMKPVIITGSSLVGAGAVWFAGNTQPADAASAGLIVQELITGVVIVLFILAAYTFTLAMFFDDSF